MIAYAVTWLALTFGLEPCISMSAYWRYRALEDRDLDTAERIDTAGLAFARAARRMAVPSAARVEAFAVARLAETEMERGEIGEAKVLYERSIRTFETTGGENQRELAVILSKYAVLLREAGETEEATRAWERGKALLSRGGEP